MEPAINTRTCARRDGFTSTLYVRVGDIDSLVASICVFGSLGEIASAAIGLRTVAVYETAEHFYGRLCTIRGWMLGFLVVVVAVVVVVSRRRFIQSRALSGSMDGSFPARESKS